MASDSARNPLEKNSRIDLHGLRPREAFVRAERALVKAIKEGRKTLYLIVGQGKHSANGKPVLKKTVQNEIIRFGFLHFLFFFADSKTVAEMDFSARLTRGTREYW